MANNESAAREVVHNQVKKIKQQEFEKSGMSNEMRKVSFSFRQDGVSGRRISPSPLGMSRQLAHHRPVTVGDF